MPSSTFLRALHSGPRRYFIAAAFFYFAPGVKGARAQSTSTQTLTVADVVRLAEKNNVDLRLAKAKSDEARGKALQDASALLPQITASARQARVYKVNLAAQGLGGFPGINPLIGPFNSFDARAQIAQNLLDIEAIQRARAGRQAEAVAALQEKLVRDQVAAAAVLACIDVLRAQKSVDTAKASVDLAQALFKQASDQKQAGSAAGIDLARAETQAAEENLRFLQTQQDLMDSLTRLKRAAGIPLDSTIQLTDAFDFVESTPPAVGAAITSAVARRTELQMAEAAVKQQRLALSSERWSNAPSVGVAGDYGLSGTAASNSKKTGSVAVHADMPILSARAHGKVIEAQGKLDEAEARYADLKSQVEEDVRLALDELSMSSQRVKTANQAVMLANRELRMTRDRFSAGVGNNLEVVQSQASLARVEDLYIAALAAYEANRINLSMALGALQDFKF